MCVKLLKNSETLKEEERNYFLNLKEAGHPTTLAWELKELFRHFWFSTTKEQAVVFFDSWYQQVIKTTISHVTKIADMIKNHLDAVLNYFDFAITNASSEGVNSKIQTVSSNARGFRSFGSFRTAVLFFCGKLDLKHHSHTN